MRKYFFMTAILLSLLRIDNAGAQGIQFASVKISGQGINNVPRISWSVPLNLNVSKLSKKSMLITGLTLRNEGVIYDYGGDRFKKRAIAIGPTISFFGKVGEGVIYSFGFGIDYNFHYKEKEFLNKERKNKEVTVREWGSNRVNKLNYSLKAGIGSAKGIYVFGEYFLREFLNRDYSEVTNGVESKPYANLTVNRFNIGIGFLINKF